MSPLPFSLAIALSSILSASLVSCYSFTFTSQPQQCANLSLHISGFGEPPYTVLIVPYGPSSLPNNIEVRRPLYQQFPGNATSLDFQLRYPANSQFVAVVSDKKGFGSGGTSKIVTVMESNDMRCFNASENMSSESFYSIHPPDQLVQCHPSRLWWEPSQIHGDINFQIVIPEGESFSIQTGIVTNRTGMGTGIEWIPNLRSGTTLSVVSGDSRGFGVGGSSWFTVSANLSPNGLCTTSPSTSSVSVPVIQGRGPLPSPPTGPVAHDGDPFLIPSIPAGPTSISPDDPVAQGGDPLPIPSIPGGPTSISPGDPVAQGGDPISTSPDGPVIGISPNDGIATLDGQALIPVDPATQGGDLYPMPAEPVAQGGDPISTSPDGPVIGISPNDGTATLDGQALIPVDPATQGGDLYPMPAEPVAQGGDPIPTTPGGPVIQDNSTSPIPSTPADPVTQAGDPSPISSTSSVSAPPTQASSTFPTTNISPSPAAGSATGGSFPSSDKGVSDPTVVGIAIGGIGIIIIGFIIFCLILYKAVSKPSQVPSLDLFKGQPSDYQPLPQLKAYHVTPLSLPPDGMNKSIAGSSSPLPSFSSVLYESTVQDQRKPGVVLFAQSRTSMSKHVGVPACLVPGRPRSLTDPGNGTSDTSKDLRRSATSTKVSVHPKTTKRSPVHANIQV